MTATADDAVDWQDALVMRVTLSIPHHVTTDRERANAWTMVLDLLTFASRNPDFSLSLTSTHPYAWAVDAMRAAIDVEREANLPGLAILCARAEAAKWKLRASK